MPPTFGQPEAVPASTGPALVLLNMWAVQTEPRLGGPLMKALATAAPLTGLQHLKRVRKQGPSLHVLLCRVDWRQQSGEAEQQQGGDQQPSTQQQEQQQGANCRSAGEAGSPGSEANGTSSSSSGQEPDLPSAVADIVQRHGLQPFIAQVPLHAPITKEQFTEWGKQWPMTWRCPDASALPHLIELSPAEVLLRPREMEAKLQAQVRGLTRDVGALREALRQEEKKRERLAAAAKAAEEARAGAEAQLKQLRYVNTKLEQERRSAKDKADAAAAQSRSGLEALRGRLAEVERSVHRRSVEAQRAVQRLHSMVQGLQAAAMPLAVAAAAAAPTAAPPALKSPLPGGGRRPAAQQQHAAAPEALHRHFAQVFGGLAQLADLFSGGNGSEGGEGAAVANPAPLLLTAPDGSRKAVHWQDQNASSPASSASLGSAVDGGCSGGGVAAAASAASREARLAAEVQCLRAALAQSQQRAAASEAKAAAAAACSAAEPASSGRVEAAMRQLDAVIPQYRAAAQALQGQVAALRDKLAASGRERAALQEEVGKWRGMAQRHEAAFAEAAAKLHSREAASLAASTQQQSQASQLSGELETARRRCADLAGRLQEAQGELAQAQTALGAKDKQVAAQQAAIRRLEATVREQRADIKAALDLVAGRPPAAAANSDYSSGAAVEGLDLLPGEAAAATAAAAGVDDYSGRYLGGGGWEAASPLPDVGLGSLGLAVGTAGGYDLGSWEAAAAGDFGAGASSADPLASLLDAANAAADAATAWAGGYDAAAAAAGAGGPAEDWGQLGDPLLLAEADAMDAWSIPAVGGSRQASPLRGSRHSSPAKRPAAAGSSKQAGSRAPSAVASLQVSPAAVPTLLAVESDIEGLESALRAALGDLSF
ncbi:hypothetical protein C2E21_3708 [Chlorella sorokiniana]|uniref:Uncharacterized protein n=1 Tax=Chlorella sorokiniana TaxID=3076 RepID=A0A2P6TUD7_CHLSO|nr:hypothetical protein C2E21_3708 [Chlorella sorokiniana]|eukprot:PRW57636.1 hypothetical protein C2E21_3708 [Chlorella sorokiniana]